MCQAHAWSTASRSVDHGLRGGCGWGHRGWWLLGPKSTYPRRTRAKRGQGDAPGMRPELRERFDDSVAVHQKAMDGKVIVKNEEFRLKNGQGELEFTLLAEGLRKFGLLWLLIQNGVLAKGSVLFWDEPETNLNPQLFSVVVEILLALQREGVQIFVTTHDYALLKEFELAATASDKVSYGALYRLAPREGVEMEVSDTPFSMENSPISEGRSLLTSWTGLDYFTLKLPGS